MALTHGADGAAGRSSNKKSDWILAHSKRGRWETEAAQFLGKDGFEVLAQLPEFLFKHLLHAACKGTLCSADAERARALVARGRS
jgi:hypothetical protein